MRKLILWAILSLLLCTPVMACESYEGCLNSGDNYAGHTQGEIPSLEAVASAEYLKAIAFKLDEISHKLDQRESPTLVDTIASGVRKSKQ